MLITKDQISEFKKSLDNLFYTNKLERLEFIDIIATTVGDDSNSWYVTTVLRLKDIDIQVWLSTYLNKNNKYFKFHTYVETLEKNNRPKLEEMLKMANFINEYMIDYGDGAIHIDGQFYLVLNHNTPEELIELLQKYTKIIKYTERLYDYQTFADTFDEVYYNGLEDEIFDMCVMEAIGNYNIAEGD